MRRVLRRIMGGQHGYSLIELLVTMVILVIVLGSLTTVFVSGSSAEASLNRRFQAQQNARLGLDRIRTDIHCATAAQAQTINTYSGLKLAVANCFAGDADDFVVRRAGHGVALPALPLYDDRSDDLRGG